jgi:AcrR family transcriptional regulator
LLDAVAKLVAERGLDDLTIAEIAQEADVGVGTFYNHFETKEQAIQEAAAARFASVDARIDQLVTEDDDPALRVAVGVLVSLDGLQPHLMWGAFLARGTNERPLLRSPLVARLMSELQRGDDTDAFEVPPGLGAILVVGAINSALTAGAAGVLTAESHPIVVRAVLRSLGLTPARARSTVEKAETRLAALPSD